MFWTRKRFNVADATRRDEALQRVEEVTEELSLNATELKRLVARLRDENERNALRD